MKKLALKTASVAVVSLALAPALISSATFADSPGRLANGASFYQVKNLTTGQVGTTVSANTGDTVKFNVEIDNSQYGQLNDVTIKAPVNGTVNVSATSTDGENLAVSGIATVTVPSGDSINYVAGSAKLTTMAGVQSNVSDTLVTSGVNLGCLGASSYEMVQYQATVTGPTPVTPVTPTTPTTPATPSTPTTPAPLPSTGMGDMVLPAVGLAAAGYTAVYAIQRRRAN